MTYDEDTAILTLDEQELHNMICGLTSMYTDAGGLAYAVDSVKIVPSGDKFSLGMAFKWQRKVGLLLDLMRLMDSELHEDIGYTC